MTQSQSLYRRYLHMCF